MANVLDSGIRDMFFSTDRRLNRLRYLKRSLLLALIIAVLNVLAKGLGNDASPIFLVVLLAVAIPVIASCFMLQIRRLHDINMTGWLVLLSLVPIVDCLLELVLIFKKGTDGHNKYGGDPLEV